MRLRYRSVAGRAERLGKIASRRPDPLGPLEAGGVDSVRAFHRARSADDQEEDVARSRDEDAAPDVPTWQAAPE